MGCLSATRTIGQYAHVHELFVSVNFSDRVGQRQRDLVKPRSGVLLRDSHSLSTVSKDVRIKQIIVIKNLILIKVIIRLFIYYIIIIRFFSIVLVHVKSKVIQNHPAACHI